MAFFVLFYFVTRGGASRRCHHKFPQPVFTLWRLYRQEANAGIDGLIRRPWDDSTHRAQSRLLLVSEKILQIHFFFFIASKADEVKIDLQPRGDQTPGEHKSNYKKKWTVDGHSGAKWINYSCGSVL